MSIQPISLEDRYDLGHRRVYMNGVQALVRLTLEQAARDRAAGLDTAGYVSGYRGSPLGTVDVTFQSAERFIGPAGVLIRPAINEDLAATAIIGTQQVGLFHRARKDGVFALWYGKGPGVDRSGDPFHHGNLYGSAAHGGVLVAAGDDHVAKSSTTAHQSEYALVHAMMPVLHPATLEEVVGFGLLGWAMSRFSGCWVGLKLVTDLVDSSGTVDLGGLPVPVPPDFARPEGGLNIGVGFNPLEQERVLHAAKLPAAQAFARANRLDRVTHDAQRVRLGIVTTGKSWRDTVQALIDLGIGEAERQALGIAVFKVGMSWPLEPHAILKFAARAEELLVVEEKRPLIEDQLKRLLFERGSAAPRVFGKADGENRQLLAPYGDLSAAEIARAIAARILPAVTDDRLLARIAALGALDPARLAALSPTRRTPYFCSGCPHNSSTVVPEGSRAFAGIGCHGLVQGMERRTDLFVQMGGEGANWIGMAPFVETGHVFQNLGDGTYFHSGLLAVRAAIAARVNITYKLLFNAAVAMTGGQPHDGELTPQRIAAQLRAEGVERIAVVFDEAGRYEGQAAFPAGVTLHDRADLEAVQRELREVPGVSLIIYDQMCATEKRRQRKRGKLADSPRKVIINPLVCEGCGDCSVQSNCLSVVPLETEFGRKRQIDQSSCNQDLSCLRGFCPSFVTVTGARLRKGRAADPAALEAVALGPPVRGAEPAVTGIFVAGIGGTGVVTVGAILAMAAHLEGREAATLDQTGLAQKGGPVTTHLKIAAPGERIAAVRLSAGAADLVIAADMVTATAKDALAVMRPGTRVVMNEAETVTGAFIRAPDFDLKRGELGQIIGDRAGSAAIGAFDATGLARRLLGDAIGANLMLVGYAWQAGLLPLSEEAILRAIELNGAAVAMNRAAFRIGRIAFADPEALAEPARPPQSLDDLIEHRAAFLTRYQNARYAAQYRAFVDRVRAAELRAVGREGALAEAVARGLAKLMAYKDEYEVGRLHGDPAFEAQLAATFEGGRRREYHLAPPLISRRDPVTGVPRKMRFGPWMRHGFALLARLKGLRGTPLDLFGYSTERRTERALPAEYRARVEEALAGLAPETHARAVAVAEAAMRIRGFGHVKERNLAAVRADWARLGTGAAAATAPARETVPA